MNWTRLLCLVSLGVHALCAGPLYFCTAADSNYYYRLLNLVGSIHKVNFKQLGEIAVFDLGLTQEQRVSLKKIKKLTLHRIEKVHPDILKRFPIMFNRTVPGWYAWKIVAVKHALEKFPYVLWIDAGTTVVRPLDALFEHIKEHGYFLCTVGGDLVGNVPAHNVRFGTTRYVIERFGLDAPDKRWILDAECVMGGLIGVSRSASDKFVMPMYRLARELRPFEDDGTAPGGKGFGRHDQPLLSYFAYSQGLNVFRQDYKQNIPMILEFQGKKMPFYVTYEKEFVNHKTHIYNSRGDLAQFYYYYDHIIKRDRGRE